MTLVQLKSTIMFHIGLVLLECTCADLIGFTLVKNSNFMAINDDIFLLCLLLVGCLEKEARVRGGSDLINEFVKV